MKVYTNMDIFDNIIVCKDCNKETERAITNKDGFKLRSFTCPSCNKVWLHPKDEEAYQEYLKLRSKPFKVKLRFVGNSYIVSIPREIIEFEDIERRLNKIIEMSLEEPGKLTLVFSRLRKIY